MSAALGADGYGVREEFDAAVRTAVVVTESEEGTATGAASTYTWRGATYTANAVGEVGASACLWRGRVGRRHE